MKRIQNIYSLIDPSLQSTKSIVNYIKYHKSVTLKKPQQIHFGQPLCLYDLFDSVLQCYTTSSPLDYKDTWDRFYELLPQVTDYNPYEQVTARHLLPPRQLPTDCTTNYKKCLVPGVGYSYSALKWAYFGYDTIATDISDKAIELQEKLSNSIPLSVLFAVESLDRTNKENAQYCRDCLWRGMWERYGKLQLMNHDVTIPMDGIPELSFDVIDNYNLWPYIPEGEAERKMLEEHYRVLKRGGLCLLGSTNNEAFSEKEKQRRVNLLQSIGFHVVTTDQKSDLNQVASDLSQFSKHAIVFQ